MCLFADGIASTGATRLDLKSNNVVTFWLRAAFALPVACSLELADCPKFTLLAAWLMLRNSPDVIDEVPPIRFGKAFTICGHRFFPGCDLPEERPVRFCVKLRIRELRRVNVQLNNGRPVGVSGLPMTHHASFRINLLARSNGILCRRDWILLRRAWRRAEPLFSQ